MLQFKFMAQGKDSNFMLQQITWVIKEGSLLDIWEMFQLGGIVGGKDIEVRAWLVWKD